MALTRTLGLTRRDFLRRGALVIGVTAPSLLAACAGQPPAAGPRAATTGPVATSSRVAGSGAPTTTPAPVVTATSTTVAQASTTASTTPRAGASDPKSARINGSFRVVQQKDSNPLHNAYLQKYVQDTAKSWGWNLDLSYEAPYGGAGSFLQNLAAAVASDQGPDMLWGNYDTVQLWHLKAIQPVDELVTAVTKQLGEPTPGFAIGGNRIEGTWWSVPYFNRVSGWWARKSWFDAKKIDVAKLTDFAQWCDAAARITDPVKREWGWGATINRSGDGESWVQTAWFEAGNRITDETGQKVIFDTDLSVEAFTWLRDLYTDATYKPAMPPGVLAWDDLGNNNAWNAGTIGFTLNAGTLYSAALKTVPRIGNDSFLVDQPAMPIGAKQKLIGSAGTGSTFYLMAGARNPDATRAMIEQMLSPDVQTSLFTYSQGYVTPGYTWGWDTDPIKNCPNNVALIYKDIVFNKNQFAGYRPAPNPLLWWSGVNQATVFTDTMGAILKGASVRDAVKQGQTRIEAIAKQLNYK